MDFIASSDFMCPSDIMADQEKRSFSDKFMLRLPDGMRDLIKQAAHENGRSMNSEIVHRLEMSFGPLEIHHIKPKSQGGEGLENLILVSPSGNRMLHMIEGLERQIEALKAEIAMQSKEP